jgi:hypothetical protein
MASQDNEKDDRKPRDADEATTAETDLTRRDMIKLSGGAAFAVAVAAVGVAEGGEAPEAQNRRRAAAPSRTAKPRFFTREEFALVDELTELIIPSDGHSPGARAAQVPAYIDFRLSESIDEQAKTVWRAGLKLVDSVSKEMHGKPFLKTTPEQRVALLTRISQNEEKPTSPEERFFRELKSRTVRAYYTSKIGIHTELEYKGNTYQKEYAGFDAT